MWRYFHQFFIYLLALHVSICSGHQCSHVFIELHRKRCFSAFRLSAIKININRKIFGTFTRQAKIYGNNKHDCKCGWLTLHSVQSWKSNTKSPASAERHNFMAIFSRFSRENRMLWKLDANWPNFYSEWNSLPMMGDFRFDKRKNFPTKMQPLYDFVGVKETTHRMFASNLKEGLDAVFSSNVLCSRHLAYGAAQ